MHSISKSWQRHWQWRGILAKDAKGLAQVLHKTGWQDWIEFLIVSDE
jgi:hypothetical protein